VSFDVCPNDIKCFILNLCEARALGRFCQMNKTFNRVLSKNERLWRDAFVREVSSDPLDLKFFDELVEEKGGSAKVAFGIMYHAMSERLFRSRTHAFCVAVIGDASPRMMKFALEGATRELASGLPHLLFSRALDCVTLAPEGLMLTLCGNAVQSRESLLRFDAVLVASETRHGESQLLRLLKLLYRIPIVDLIMDTSMAPRNVRCIDFEARSLDCTLVCFF
jgi:hypothetical protein